MQVVGTTPCKQIGRQSLTRVARVLITIAAGLQFRPFPPVDRSINPEMVATPEKPRRPAALRQRMNVIRQNGTTHSKFLGTPIAELAINR
jgi:hypothetical protein